jgi:23S rRNA pseudouridine1911/1915/1917 synthase
MKIEILYEDKDALVVNKTAGILVHHDARSKEKSLSDLILERYPEIKKVGEPWKAPTGELIYRPGIVHRLDKDTSGVLIVAKNQESFEFLKKQFQEQKIKKTYHAIVFGWLKNEKGTINKPIGRSPRDFRRYLAGRGARGTLREAVTEYKVLKKFEDKEENKFTLVELSPKTGRTHQLRVHMKYLNHPIICDPLYLPNHPCYLGLKRMALHASTIEFKLPKGKMIKVEAKLPKDLSAALKKFS